MPFNRRSRYYKKRRVYRKKRVFRRRRYGPSKPLGRTHVFKRTTYQSTISSAAAVDSPGAIDFRLNYLPNYDEFSNLFDEYFIASVKVMFIPIKVQLNISPTYTVPHFIFVIDKDDVSVPTNFDTLMQYPNVRIGQGNRRYTLKFGPRSSTAVYNGVTDAYSSKRQYIDCNNTAVPHYGVKYVMGKFDVADAFQYHVWVQYTLKLRGVR